MSESFVPTIVFTKSEQEVAEELYAALSTVGFACFTGTGLCQKVKEYSKEALKFFHLPTEEKKKFSLPPENKWIGGWYPIGRLRPMQDRPHDYREGVEMRLASKDYYSGEPKLLMGDCCWALWDSFSDVADRINYLIGLGLKLEDPEIIKRAHNFNDADRNNTMLRVNYYPPIDPNVVKNGQMRTGEHTDFGSMTLLFADTPGLQVLNQITGEFEDVPCVADGIFMNIGDILQIWSGDKLLANKHRVLIPSDKKLLCKERVSVVFFCTPDKDTVLKTLDGSGKCSPTTAFEHVQKRVKSVVTKEHE